ncbi:hypothetical protein DFH09DRAFT_1418241 [Mycena vulgaris]|nr:hypothetical protein DFH09DRAFT_1418241 [Mycena vulgaris]
MALIPPSPDHPVGVIAQTPHCSRSRALHRTVLDLELHTPVEHFQSRRINVVTYNHLVAEADAHAEPDYPHGHVAADSEEREDGITDFPHFLTAADAARRTPSPRDSGFAYNPHIIAAANAHRENGPHALAALAERTDAFASTRAAGYSSDATYDEVAAQHPRVGGPEDDGERAGYSLVLVAEEVSSAEYEDYVDYDAYAPDDFTMVWDADDYTSIDADDPYDIDAGYPSDASDDTETFRGDDYDDLDMARVADTCGVYRADAAPTTTAHRTTQSPPNFSP